MLVLRMHPQSAWRRHENGSGLFTIVTRRIPHRGRGFSRRDRSARYRRRGALESSLPLDRFEPLVPRRSDPVEPLLDLGQAIGAEFADAVLAGGPDADEPRLAEPPAML